MNETEKEALKLQNTLRFIEAAKELIDTEGISKVSVRKIAEKAGFHNSTIYLYFKDANQLILLASLKHFTDYSRLLSEYSKKNATPQENFFAIWDAFGQTVFKKPEIFYNFFFGKHSNNLTPIIEQYYSLFPEEKASYSKEIEAMYYEKNIQTRCLKILEPLVNTEGISVSQDNLETVNLIIVSCLKYLLEQKCENPDLDADALNKQLLTMLHCIVGV